MMIQLPVCRCKYIVKRTIMNQLNNISTPKGRKVFSRRILFFFFCFSSHCFGSGTLVKKNHGSGDKAGQHRKRDYHGERKGWRTEPPQKV